jgi:hypothetical protein
MFEDSYDLEEPLLNALHGRDLLDASSKGAHLIGAQDVGRSHRFVHQALMDSVQYVSGCSGRVLGPPTQRLQGERRRAYGIDSAIPFVTARFLPKVDALDLLEEFFGAYSGDSSSMEMPPE